MQRFAAIPFDRTTCFRIVCIDAARLDGGHRGDAQQSSTLLRIWVVYSDCDFRGTFFILALVCYQWDLVASKPVWFCYQERL